ncbi:unnamed protein product [Candidula unifasciata]|uniref:Uncharacterized protein n=1 Tax=Candidula unifasciata TaxID=100452 RepID=A0A8S3YSK9_9EUPU|nr:unnamed protein product [Candidula unifasciata]
MTLTCCSILILGLSIIVGSGSQEFSVVDLTHELNADTVYWPGNPGFLFTILNRGPTPGGYWYESNKFETSEHGGTHLDAPAHFAEGKWRVHEIPAERLVGYGVVINVIDCVVENPDYRLKYFFLFFFSGFHPDAIDWLIQYRNISMIGVDTPSTDYGQSKTFDTHQRMAKAGIIGLENVNNLDKIPPSGSTIFVGVIKLFDGSGGPVRILALTGRKAEPACNCPLSGRNSGVSLSGCFLVLVVSMLFLSWMI